MVTCYLLFYTSDKCLLCRNICFRSLFLHTRKNQPQGPEAETSSSARSTSFANRHFKFASADTKISLLAMAAGYRQLQKPPGQVRYKALYDKKEKEMIEEMIAAGDTGDRIIPEAVVAEVNKALISNAVLKRPNAFEMVAQLPNEQAKGSKLKNAWAAWRAARPNQTMFAERRALQKEMYKKRKEERRVANIAKLEKIMQAKEEKNKQEQTERDEDAKSPSGSDSK